MARTQGPVPQIVDPRDNRIAGLEQEAARWRKRAERDRSPLRDVPGALPRRCLTAASAPRKPDQPNQDESDWGEVLHYTSSGTRGLIPRRIGDP